jgi:hypothetical protein
MLHPFQSKIMAWRWARGNQEATFAALPLVSSTLRAVTRSNRSEGHNTDRDNRCDPFALQISLNFPARQHCGQANEQRCGRKIDSAVNVLDIKRQKNAGWHRAALPIARQHLASRKNLSRLYGSYTSHRTYVKDCREDPSSSAQKVAGPSEDARRLN